MAIIKLIITGNQVLFTISIVFKLAIPAIVIITPATGEKVLPTPAASK